MFFPRELLLIVFLFQTSLLEIINTDSPSRPPTAEEKVIQEEIEDLYYEDGEPPEWTLDDLKTLENQDVTKAFLEEVQVGLLPKTASFFLLEPDQHRQAIKIFDILFFTKDVHELIQVGKFLKTMVNRDQLNYALSLALLHRPDINVRLPPWYEVFPNYFIRQDDLNKLKTSLDEGVEKPSIVSTTDSEATRLEGDPLLGNLYYNTILHWPSWMDYTKYNLTLWPKRGQVFAYSRSQFAHRVALERLIRGPAPEYLDGIISALYDDYETGLASPTGENLSTNSSVSPATFLPGFKKLGVYLQLLDMMSIKLKVTLENGTVVNARDMNTWSLSTFGDIMFNTTLNPCPSCYKNFFEATLGAFGGDLTEPKVIRNVMGSPMSAFRHKNFLDHLLTMDALTRDFATSLFYYEKEELTYEGVSIEEVNVDRLETFEEDFIMDVGRFLTKKKSPGVEPRSVYKRINHKPFSLRLKVSSSLPEEELAVIRVFLGPDLENLNKPDDKFMQVQLDKFRIKLTPGENNILRHSSEFAAFVEDKDILQETYKDRVTKKKVQCGLPAHMILPQGTKEGLPLTMTVVVSKFVKLPDSPPRLDRYMDNFVTCGEPEWDELWDMGYPWDRNLVDENQVFPHPNFRLQKVLVFHT